jgi:S-adenosylmethionine decarboxylase proenzyme
MHLTADLRGCDPAQPPMHDPQALRALCLASVAAAGLQAVGELFHAFPAPGGVTGVVLLAESHVAIHTWPELRAVTLDVYVCNLGRDNGDRAHGLLARLREAFRPSAVESHQLRRGALVRSAAAAAAPAACPSVKASSKTE